jgi:hypothetical protein
MPDARRNLDLGGEGFPEVNPANDTTTKHKNEEPETPKRKTAVKSKIRKKERRSPEPKRERSKSRDSENKVQPRERSKSRDSEDKSDKDFKPWDFKDPRKKKSEVKSESEEELIPAKPEPADQPVPTSDDEEIIPEDEYSKGYKRRHPPDSEDEGWHKSPKRKDKDFDGLIIDHSLSFLTD